MRSRIIPGSDVRRRIVFWLLAAVCLALCGLSRADDRALPPGPPPVVGERMHFEGRWLGIHVGQGWIGVTERIQLDGRPVYHLEAHGGTNHVLSKLYPIEDALHSFVDVDTLEPVRFEKDQREGHYRAHEVVIFDRVHRIASYQSLVNQSTKQVPIAEGTHDLLSILFWLRQQPLQPGKRLTVNLYTDEKVYPTTVTVSAPREVEVLKRGTFQCVIMEPLASFQGILIKRGRIWGYVTADERRLPVLVKATTPWGPMAAVLERQTR